MLSPEDWEPNRRIRAELIAWLCAGQQAARLIHWKGVRVYGPEIVGRLDLSSATIPFPTAFRHCRLNSYVDLNSSEVLQLDFSGSRVHKIEADGIVVKNDARFREGFVAMGEVRLVGAQIGGTLDCEKASFAYASAKLSVATGKAAKT